MSRRSLWFAPVLVSVAAAFAGVANPDISVVGQLFATRTDSPELTNAKRYSLALGETELALDAALNPYFNGAFVIAIDNHGEVGVEEAYAAMVRGLPLNLGFKAGRYRLDFGKLNLAHPHAYPFIRTPRVLDPQGAALLPGDESFDETAVQLSTLIPVTDDWSVALSGNALQGASFHPDSQGTAPAWLAHLSTTFLVDAAAFDLGVSATRGTNDLAAGTHTTVIGGDLKAKIPLSPQCVVTAGAEGLYKRADLPDSLGAIDRDDRYGFYAYVNAQVRTRWNGGVLYEQFREPDGARGIARAIKPFAGFSVLEESTVVRLSYEYFTTTGTKAANTVEAQLLFSMGPHKAHRF
jgi:hypothetical protein